MRILWIALISMIAVIFAGCTASNAVGVANLAPDAYVAEFQQTGTQHVLLDVRTPSEFASGYIANAVNIPLQDLQSRLSELPEGVPVVVYCRSGNRSQQATSLLAAAGYSPVYDLGGTQQWTAAGYSLQ